MIDHSLFSLLPHMGTCLLLSVYPCQTPLTPSGEQHASHPPELLNVSHCCEENLFHIFPDLFPADPFGSAQIPASIRQSLFVAEEDQSVAGGKGATRGLSPHGSLPLCHPVSGESRVDFGGNLGRRHGCLVAARH